MYWYICEPPLTVTPKTDEIDHSYQHNKMHEYPQSEKEKEMKESLQPKRDL